MARPKPPLPAKLVCALFSASPDLIQRGVVVLQEHFGPLDFMGPSYLFRETNHYKKTMGAGLEKQIVSFENLVEQGELAEIKNLTNGLEEELALGDHGLSVSRPINLDPGLITGAKLILATMKDFSHRIYLGQNVYAEVTLMYVRGKFRLQPWTYPDYQREDNLAFLEKVRQKYMEQITP